MKRCFLFLVLSIAFTLCAQTGPGGVGNTTNNLIWLEADDISALSDGDAISNWSDGSGNANNFSQAVASFQPQYRTGIINGLPVVRFFQTNGRLVRNPFVSPTTAVSAIYVNANVESNDGLISYASSAADNDFLIFNSANIGIYRGNNVNSGVSANDGAFHIINAGWRSSDGSTELWKDGTQSFTATHRTGTSITSGGSIAIGGEQDGIDASWDAAQDHLGDYAEVILFNTYLNTAQHIIVANYLAAKYNLSIANDYYTHEVTHGNDVAGIGREDGSNTHTAARSADILQIENANSLNLDNEYLLFGHDNADATTSWTTTEAPDAGVNIQRIAREWRLDETGDIGTADVIIDVNDLPALPAGHTMYALIVDSDGDFSSGASVYELTLSAGTEYNLSGIDFTDGDHVSIAAVRPVLDHTESTSSGFEINNASIELNLNFIPSTDRTVNFSTTDGTALSAQPDYTSIAGGTATITAGNQTTNYTVLINNDVIVEPSENFTISLSAPSVGINLGTNTTHTYTINDDDDARKIYFDLTTSSGLESVTSINTVVSINNIDITNPTTVDYSVTGGTATGGGTDFTLASGTLTIPAGSSSAPISFTVNNESLFELDETIVIELSNPTNCNLDGVMPFGGTGFLSHTYTIINDDAAPEIEFDLSTNTGNEASSPITIQVNLSALSGADASATYTLTGTASGLGVDYTLASGTISILEGTTTNTLSASINNDVIEELNETIVITLSIPVNSTLGTNTVHTYTIIDDDAFGCLGPGGVGDMTTNKLWVKPSDLTVVSDGTDITLWPDASGNAHDLTQSDASFTPRYFSNVINNQPVVRFNQANGRIIHNGFTDFPSSEITTIFVNSNSDSNDGLVSYATTSNNNEYLLFSSNNLRIFRAANNVTSGTAVNGSTFRIIGNTWRASDGNTRLYSNGTQTYTGTVSTGSNIVTGGCLAIAGEQDAVNGGYAAGQAHQGDFAEVIVYNQVINSARRKIIDNYLSAKYNLSIANDMYSYDSPGNYEFEVAGIGRDDNSNFHQAAQGSAILKILNPSSLDDGDYQFWGHDNANFSFNTTDVPPGTVDNRMNRVWRIDETGDMGTVTVQFDLSGFTVANTADLVLLIDSDDGSFVNASITPISSFSGNTATFNAIDFASGNWFTVASLSNSNTLPIELVYFDANIENEEVVLTWETATEINNDYFTIERTLNGKEWQKVTTVKGAGNSTVPLKYATLDTTPLIGTSYYRLKQTDYDGKYTYSDLRSVSFSNKTGSKLKVYPNPTNGRIIIEAEEEELTEIHFFDLIGSNLTNQIQFIQQNSHQVIIDISQLPSGSYLIKTKHKTSLIVKH